MINVDSSSVSSFCSTFDVRGVLASRDTCRLIVPANGLASTAGPFCMRLWLFDCSCFGRCVCLVWLRLRYTIGMAMTIYFYCISVVSAGSLSYLTRNVLRVSHLLWAYKDSNGTLRDSSSSTLSSFMLCYEPCLQSSVRQRVAGSCTQL